MILAVVYLASVIKRSGPAKSNIRSWMSARSSGMSLIGIYLTNVPTVTTTVAPVRKQRSRLHEPIGACDVWLNISL